MNLKFAVVLVVLRLTDGLRNQDASKSRALLKEPLSAMSGARSRKFRVRLILIRHGFSCANVYKFACANGIPSSSIQNTVMDAMDIVANTPSPITLGPVNRSFGIKGQDFVDMHGKRSDDCCVKVTGPGLQNDVLSKNGNIVPARHFYKDPMLTTCAAHQSVLAGEALMTHLEKNGVHLHFLGSTTLMRTFETALLMVVKNARSKRVLSPGLANATKVVQVPFGNERDHESPFEADNFPYPPRTQRKLIAKTYRNQSALSALNTKFLGKFPREAQQLAKFKVVLATRLAEAAEACADPSVPTRCQAPSFSSGLAARLAASDIPPDGNSLGVDDSGEAKSSLSWRDADSGQMETYSIGEEFNADRWDEGDAGPILNIAVTSHSSFIKDFCRLEQKPNNNAAVQRLFQLEVVDGVDGSRSYVFNEQSGPCKTIMDAPPKPNKVERRDVLNCKPPAGSFDYSSVLDLAEDTPDGQPTVCEVEATQEGAFPTFPL